MERRRTHHRGHHHDALGSKLRAFSMLLLSALAACQLTHRSDKLKSDLNAIVASYPDATVAIALSDPATGLSLDINGDSVFHAASTMKVPVMIELFRQAAAGTFALTDSLLIRNRFTSIYDGSTYEIGDDSDTEIYSLIGRHMSILDLTDRLITSSSNLATNLLIEQVTPDSTQALIERMGTKNMTVRRGVEDLKAFEAGLNNTTSAADLLIILRHLLEGRAVSADASRQMLDIMKREPWNEMVLAGLPAGSEVAHKTGTITAHHHDAAIAYPAGRSPYILVILTRGIQDRDVSGELGRKISKAVYSHLGS